MSRGVGQSFSAGTRRQAVQILQDLIAAGVSDADAVEQVAERYHVTSRTGRRWLAEAYAALSAVAEDDRRKLLGVALRRRRIVMARSARAGDWPTYLRAAESEAKLLGLDAPKQTEHHVLVEKAQDLSAAVIEVVRDYFIDDAEGQNRFVFLLRERLGIALSARSSASPLVLDAVATEKDSPPENAT